MAGLFHGVDENGIVPSATAPPSQKRGLFHDIREPLGPGESLVEPRDFTSASAPGALPTDSPATAKGIENSLAYHDSIGGHMTFGNSMLLEAGDEIGGTFAGLWDAVNGGSFDEGYNRHVGNMRREMDMFAQRHPGQAVAAQIAGAVPSALLPGGAAVRGGTLASKVLRGATTGAALGGTTGFAAGEGGVDNRLASGKTGAMLGATVGAAAPVAGAAVGRGVGKFIGRRAAPTDEAVSTEARALYDAAEQSGVAFKDRALQRLGLIRPRLEGGNRALPRLRPELHPNALEALNVIDDVARQPTISFADLMTTRQVLRDAVTNAKRGSADERFASEALDLFDAWRDGLKPGDVYPGAVPAAEANRMFNEANRLWGIKKRADIINDIMTRAQADEGGIGFEKSVQNQFRALAKNKSRMAGFSTEEQAALRKVANGGNWRKLLTLTSKAMPSQSLGAVASAGFANPLPTAMATAGSAARGGINVSTRRALNNARATVNLGGQAPFDPVAAKTIGDYGAYLTNMAGQPGAQQARPSIEIMFPNDVPVYR